MRHSALDQAPRATRQQDRRDSLTVRLCRSYLYYRQLPNNAGQGYEAHNKINGIHVTSVTRYLREQTVPVGSICPAGAADLSSSRTPPRAIRWKGRPSVRGIDWPNDVFSVPGNQTNLQFLFTSTISARDKRWMRALMALVTSHDPWISIEVGDGISPSLTRALEPCAQ